MKYQNFDIEFVIYAKFWVKMASIFKFYQELKKKIFSLEIEKSKKWEKIKTFNINNNDVIFTQNFA